MATLTVRNLDDELARRLRIRAAEHGRSAEAEHRELPRLALAAVEEPQLGCQDVAERLAAFRYRTAGRGSPSSLALLEETRGARLETLAGPRDGA